MRANFLPIYNNSLIVYKKAINHLSDYNFLKWKLKQLAV